jgi:hypothetical protein
MHYILTTDLIAINKMRIGYAIHSIRYQSQHDRYTARALVSLTSRDGRTAHWVIHHSGEDGAGRYLARAEREFVGATT